jgi:hypothetical protein
VGSTVWLALVLWLVMCIGELGIVSQSVLAMYAWIALFALPYFYRTCRHALDALVEETLLFVAEVVRGGGPQLPVACYLPVQRFCLSCRMKATPAQQADLCSWFMFHSSMWSSECRASCCGNGRAGPVLCATSTPGQPACRAP